MKHGFFCLLMFLILSGIHQAVAFELKDSFSKITLNEHSQVFHTADSLGAYTIDSLIGAGAIPLSPSKVSPGFSQDYYWVQFSLEAKEHAQDLLLELDNPHVNFAYLYGIDSSGTVLLGKAGDRLTFSERTYDHRKMIFPILLSRHQSRKYLLMIDKRNAAVSFPLTLWEKETFRAIDQKKSISYGIYFGIVLFIAFTSILFGVFTKSRAFLYYGIYALMLSIYFFTGLGYSFQYIYPWSDTLNNYTRTILIMLITVTFIEFTITFFNIKKTQRSTFLFNRGIQITMLLIFFIWPFFMEFYEKNMTLLLNILYTCFGLAVIALLNVTFHERRTQSQKVIVFLGSFSFILLGSVATIFMEYGLISESWFFINPIMLGGVIEILSLTAYMIYMTQFLIREKQTAIKNSQELNQKIDALSTKIDTEEKGRLKLKSGALLTLDQIIYINADGHYLEYFMTNRDKPEIDRNTMKLALKGLPEPRFIRIHRSTIVNSAHIKAVYASELLLHSGKTLGISRSYKPNVAQFLSTTSN